MRSHIIASILFLLLTGCNRSESPRGVYDRYVQLEVSGITAEQFMSAYSQRKQLGIEASINELMEKNGWSHDQVLERVLPIFQTIAKCKNLNFLNEEINGKKATLAYKSTDDCTKGEVNIKKEVIYMVYENGWKIDDNLIQEL